MHYDFIMIYAQHAICVSRKYVVIKKVKIFYVSSLSFREFQSLAFAPDKTRTLIGFWYK